MKRGDRGAALILVLGAVALLTVVAVELAARSTAESLRTARLSRDAAFRRLIDSGSEVARGLLSEREPESFTFWGGPWNREFRFSLGEGETATVTVSDESGKINVARALTQPEAAGTVRRQLARLFEYLRRHEPSRAGEWRDIEQRVRKRLDSPEPLLTLGGFRGAGLSLLEVYGPGGLFRYLTCFGNAQININTAPRGVLYALDEEFDDALVERIDTFRGKGEGKPGTYKAFQEPGDLTRVDGVVLQIFKNGEARTARNLQERVQTSITTRSSTLSARIRAVVRGREREAWAFLKPDGSAVVLEEIVP
jgi:hypothetical protein